MRLDLMGYSSWYRTNNFADFCELIQQGNSLDLDCLARSLERWGAGTSFRRLSRDGDLRVWCQEAFKNLSPKLRRSQKRVLGIPSIISIMESSVMMNMKKQVALSIDEATLYDLGIGGRLPSHKAD